MVPGPTGLGDLLTGVIWPGLNVSPPSEPGRVRVGVVVSAGVVVTVVLDGAVYVKLPVEKLLSMVAPRLPCEKASSVLVKLAPGVAEPAAPKLDEPVSWMEWSRRWCRSKFH